MSERTKTIIRGMGCILFAGYLFLLAHFLFFSEKYGRTAEPDGLYRYNLVLFKEIRRFWVNRESLGAAAYTNILGNVLAFFPFGFILPVITRRMQSGFLITLSGFGFSLLVELLQLVTKVGCFDVDDLLLNTLGAAAGYLLFRFCNYLRRKYYGKKI